MIITKQDHKFHRKVGSQSGHQSKHKVRDHKVGDHKVGNHKARKHKVRNHKESQFNRSSKEKSEVMSEAGYPVMFGSRVIVSNSRKYLWRIRERGLPEVTKLGS